MEVLALICLYILGFMTRSLYEMSKELNEAYKYEEERQGGDFKIFDLRRPQR